MFESYWVLYPEDRLMRDEAHIWSSLVNPYPAKQFCPVNNLCFLCLLQIFKMHFRFTLIMEAKTMDHDQTAKGAGLQIYGGCGSLSHDFKIWPITFQGSKPS